MNPLHHEHEVSASLKRHDYSIILDQVEEGARVLDLGCGDGNLLYLLRQQKQVKSYGIELDQDHVISCVGKGLSVFQGNVDEGLRDFEDKSFDYVILNQTLPVVYRPAYVFKEMLRVGEKCIISFPNFACWRIRLRLLFAGRMPVNDIIPYEWYETPYIHQMTIKDFTVLARKLNCVFWQQHYFPSLTGGVSRQSNRLRNWSAAYALFILSSID